MSVIFALVYGFFSRFFLFGVFFLFCIKNYIIELNSISHGHLLHISGIPFHISFWTYEWWLEKCLGFAHRSQMELEHYQSTATSTRTTFPKSLNHLLFRKPIHISSLMCSVCWFLFRFASTFFPELLFYLLLFVCTYNSYLTGAHISLICWALFAYLCAANTDLPFSLFSILFSTHTIATHFAWSKYS